MPSAGLSTRRGAQYKRRLPVAGEPVVRCVAWANLSVVDGLLGALIAGHKARDSDKLAIPLRSVETNGRGFCAELDTSESIALVIRNNEEAA